MRAASATSHAANLETRSHVSRCALDGDDIDNDVYLQRFVAIFTGYDGEFGVSTNNRSPPTDLG